MNKYTTKTAKSTGKVYTPDFIVNNILDFSEYYGNHIIQKHIIDNSCGDGAFLTEIVERYCKQALDLKMPPKKIVSDLETYIHGIEIDHEECKKCICNVNSIAKKYGLEGVSWDIRCGNTLFINDYDGKMDYVVGNPPYIRVHNLGDNLPNVKKHSFAKSGMTDLFIVFYEIGINMLNKNGILGYITPSSFFSSVAGKSLRFYIAQNNLLEKLVDLKHFQAFNSTTYTAMVILRKNKTSSSVQYFQYSEESLSPYYVDTLNLSDFFIDENFYFSSKQKLDQLKTIKLSNPYYNPFTVKNGFATLADNFFISNFMFSDYVIPILKASTGNWTKCLFPYEKGKLVAYQKLTSNDDLRNYYKNNELLLKNRSLENTDNWYGFGRSQGINDVYKNKFAINTLLRTFEDIKLTFCESGTGVYSGLYILTDVTEDEIKSILINEDFISYISMLGKYKSGGYYTFSSKDLEKYLNYKYSQNRSKNYEQLRFSANT